MWSGWRLLLRFLGIRAGVQVNWAVNWSCVYLVTDTVDAEARKKLSEVVKLARGSMSLSAFGRLLGV